MKKTNKFPTIFIISLRNSPRRKIIARRLHGLGLKFEFFDAINGKELSENQLNNVDYEFNKLYLREKLTLGEIGCALSHISLYEKMVNENIEEMLILEDDAIVSQEFEKIVLDILNKVPSRKEIIFLEHGKAKFHYITRKLVDNYRLVRYRYPSKKSKRSITRTTAYIINLSGAKKLLQYSNPIKMPSDYLTGLIQLTKIHAYGVEPPCVFRGLDSDSEIDAIEYRNNNI